MVVVLSDGVVNLASMRACHIRCQPVCGHMERAGALRRERRLRCAEGGYRLIHSAAIEMIPNQMLKVRRAVCQMFMMVSPFVDPTPRTLGARRPPPNGSAEK